MNIASKKANGKTSNDGAAKKISPVSPGRGRPKGSNAEDKILGTAEIAFAKYGYHMCTVEHLLEVSGVSRRNFYRFFNSKDEVFSRIFLEKTTALESLIKVFDQPAKDSGDARAKIELLFEYYLRGNFSVGALLPVLIQEAQAVPEYRQIRERLLGRYKTVILRILGEWASPSLSDLLLDGFLAAIERMVLVQAQRLSSEEKKVEEIKDACLQFVPLLFNSAALEQIAQDSVNEEMS